MYIKDIEEACRKVINGDLTALQQLGLEDARYRSSKPLNISPKRLQINYDAVLNTVVAARELQLSFLEKMCQTTTACLQSFAKAQNIMQTHAVHGQDVAEIMLALIDEEKSKLWKEGDEAKESSTSEEEECEVSEIVESKTVIGVAEQQSQTVAMEVDSQEEKEVTSKKRKVVVVVEEQQSNTAAIQEGKEVRLKKRKKVVVKVEEEQRDTPAIAVEHPEESEEIEESEESKESEESEESEDNADKPEDSKAEETPAANTKPRQMPSLSHHVNRKCVVGHHCLYEGPNLKRHLRNVHVKNAHIEDRQVERYFALGLRSHNIRGPPEKTKSG